MTVATAWPFPATEPVFLRIGLSAIIAGVLSGLLLTALQAYKVEPLILAAETYEEAAAHDDGEAEAWAPEGAIERPAFRLATNMLTGVSFALLLSAALALRDRRVDLPSPERSTGFAQAGWRQGLAWGLAGYAAFSLAPALGMPPELPGMVAGDLAARQAWWVGTVAATATGLWALLLAANPWLKVAGVALLSLPHLIGAPQVPQAAGSVPPELAAAFVSATLVANLLFWLAMGGLAAAAFARLGRGAGHGAERGA